MSKELLPEDELSELSQLTQMLQQAQSHFKTMQAKKKEPGQVLEGRDSESSHDNNIPNREEEEKLTIENGAQILIREMTERKRPRVKIDVEYNMKVLNVVC